MTDPITPPSPAEVAEDLPEVVTMDTVDLPAPIPEPPVKSLDAAYRLGKTEPAIADIYGHINSLKDQISQLSGAEGAQRARVMQLEAELAALQAKVSPNPEVQPASRSRWWEHLLGGSH